VRLQAIVEVHGTLLPQLQQLQERCTAPQSAAATCQPPYSLMRSLPGSSTPEALDVSLIPPDCEWNHPRPKWHFHFDNFEFLNFEFCGMLDPHLKA